MALLLKTSNAFEARLIAARLGSDGILAELRGATDTPYPGLFDIAIYVREDDLELARALTSEG